MTMSLHRQTYVPTEQEHKQIELAIINFPRRNKPETNVRDWVIFKLASMTGLRINEILKIKLEHVNWQRRIINIPAENSKNKRESFVWLCPEIFNILEEYIKRFKPMDLLFYNLSNNSARQAKLEVTGFEYNWRAYLNFAGLGDIKFIDRGGMPRRKIRFHSATRTYFINLLLKNNPGLNLADLSRVSRHRSIQCLYDYYLRFNDLKIWQTCLLKVNND